MSGATGHILVGAISCTMAGFIGGGGSIVLFAIGFYMLVRGADLLEPP